MKKNWSGICLRWLLVVILVGSIVVAIDWRKERSLKARAELLSVYERVDIGSPRSGLIQLFDEAGFELLTLHQTSKNECSVRTPLEWGAINWLLWIEMEDEIVTGVRIRYQDNRTQKPTEAPADKIKVSQQ